jgi:hypothetical protein
MSSDLQKTITPSDTKKKITILEDSGFGQKKATFREFVFIFLGSLGFYVFLHWYFPPNSRTWANLPEVIKEIDKVQRSVQGTLTVNVTTTPSPASSITPSPASSITPSPASSITPSPASSITPSPVSSITPSPASSITPSPVSSITPSPVSSITLLPNLSNLKEVVESLEKQLQPFLLENSENQDRILSIFKTLKDQDFTVLNQANNPKRQATLKTINQKLLEIEEILSEVIKHQSLLWSDNRKWLEVIFWSFFATLLYVIGQTSDYYIKTGNKSQADLYLERRKPQYYLLLLRSPFLALVILFLLNSSGIGFSIAGATLAFDALAPEALASIAFLLGFFNTIEIAELEILVKAIFPDAYKKIVRKIDIDPYESKVEYGKCCQFVAIPDVKVKWSILSKPPVGIIDIATGMYIAPPGFGYIYDEKGEMKPPDNTLDKLKYEQVIIRAEREDDPSISSLAMLILIEKDRSEDPNNEGEESLVLIEKDHSEDPNNEGEESLEEELLG